MWSLSFACPQKIFFTPKDYVSLFQNLFISHLLVIPHLLPHQNTYELPADRHQTLFSVTL